ncbi:bestrophin family protein [Parafilimonas sp.]|uniref:bestrophin family protein n=1 Tax=Parafilimonas sp. TaxID=1969739 RepID=UPI0039E2E0A6
MRSYNPKDWRKIVFDFNKSDTLRQLIPVLLVVAVYSFVVVFLEKTFVPDKFKAQIRSLSIIHTLLGFVISMLLVFRTNTAYDRWWEGRKLWGALVNNSRNLAIKLNSLIAPEDKNTKQFFAELIPRFALELKNHLQAAGTRYSLDQFEHPEIPGFKSMRHVPEQVVGAMTERLMQMQRDKQITVEQMLFINPELTSFMDICGACERIKNTPIPFSYSSFIKKFILFYTLALPVGYSLSLGFLIVPVVVFVLYVLASLEFIAEEIEEPFGNDENDLPMDKIIETITKNVTAILV